MSERVITYDSSRNISKNPLNEDWEDMKNFIEDFYEKYPKGFLKIGNIGMTLEKLHFGYEICSKCNLTYEESVFHGLLCDFSPVFSDTKTEAKNFESLTQKDLDKINMIPYTGYISGHNCVTEITLGLSEILSGCLEDEFTLELVPYNSDDMYAKFLCRITDFEIFE